MLKQLQPEISSRWRIYTTESGEGFKQRCFFPQSQVSRTPSPKTHFYYPGKKINQNEDSDSTYAAESPPALRLPQRRLHVMLGADVSPQCPCVETLSPQVMVLGGAGLWEVIRS